MPKETRRAAPYCTGPGMCAYEQSQDAHLISPGVSPATGTGGTERSQMRRARLTGGPDMCSRPTTSPGWPITSRVKTARASRSGDDTAIGTIGGGGGGGGGGAGAARTSAGAS